jgi:hypothetical protein
MPKGTVQYPEVMKLIESNLGEEPQNISQIMDTVKAKLADEKNPIPSLNRDTVKNYLEILCNQNKAKKVNFGKFGQLKAYCLP